MRVVGREHERVLAERLQGVAQRLLALVELDALEILRPANVLARLLLERRQRVAGHLGQLVQPRGPEGPPAVPALKRGEAQLRVAVPHAPANQRRPVALRAPYAAGRALAKDAVP